MVKEIQGLRSNSIAEFFEENDQLHLYLDQFLKDREQNRKPAVVVFFTNGSFDGIMKKLVNDLTS